MLVPVMVGFDRSLRHSLFQHIDDLFVYSQIAAN